MAANVYNSPVSLLAEVSTDKEASEIGLEKIYVDEDGENIYLKFDDTVVATASSGSDSVKIKLEGTALDGSSTSEVELELSTSKNEITVDQNNLNLLKLDTSSSAITNPEGIEKITITCSDSGVLKIGDVEYNASCSGSSSAKSITNVSDIIAQEEEVDFTLDFTSAVVTDLGTERK